MELRWLSLCAFAAFVSVAGCTSSFDETPPERCPSRGANATSAAIGSNGDRTPIVFIAIDGSRWQDIFEPSAPDLVPVLHHIGNDEGVVVGTNPNVPIRASGPDFVSLPGYTEMLTGAPSTCRDNSCIRTGIATVLDRAFEAGLTVAAFGSWARVERACTVRPGRFFVSTGHEDGTYRPDEETIPLALDHLATAKPDLLFVSLGDTDEDAHRNDRDAYNRSLTRADTFVGSVRAALDAMGERGRSTYLFVTADHGRADNFTEHGEKYPESARVWLVASGPRIQARGGIASPYERRLSDIGATIAALMSLPTTGTPCGGEPISELFE